MLLNKTMNLVSTQQQIMNWSKQPHEHLIEEVALKAGDILYREGDDANCGYVISSGEVTLYRETENGRIDIERRGTGSLLGELSILTSQPRLVNVVASEDTHLYQISAKHLMGRYRKIDPVIRASIETSIDLVSRLKSKDFCEAGTAPLVSPTVRNSDKLLERLRLECDILEGLDKQQFSMVFQPIVHLADQSIVGFETLMRWQHPKLGNIPPFVFIEVAEKMGSICRLTDFAILETCRALSEFQQLTPESSDLFASVNVSGEDIGRSDFIDFLAHALDLYGLKPSHLKLEVTETALVPDSKDAEKTLKRLENFGCGIAVDDFGVGYSNLAYLKELPLTAIKIDRAFAGDACKNSISQSIVKMMIGLGRELGVDVVAEGLETQEDVDALLSLGCDLAQGYFFSKPVTELDFINMIAPDAFASQKIA